MSFTFRNKSDLTVVTAVLKVSAKRIFKIAYAAVNKRLQTMLFEC